MIYRWFSKYLSRPKGGWWYACIYYVGVLFLEYYIHYTIYNYIYYIVLHPAYILPVPCIILWYYCNTLQLPNHTYPAATYPCANTFILLINNNLLLLLLLRLRRRRQFAPSNNEHTILNIYTYCHWLILQYYTLNDIFSSACELIL